MRQDFRLVQGGLHRHDLSCSQESPRCGEKSAAHVGRLSGSDPQAGRIFLPSVVIRHFQAWSLYWQLARRTGGDHVFCLLFGMWVRWGFGTVLVFSGEGV